MAGTQESSSAQLSQPGYRDHAKPVYFEESVCQDPPHDEVVEALARKIAKASCELSPFPDGGLDG